MQHSTIRIEMTQNMVEGKTAIENQTAAVEHRSMRAQLIEIGEKPIHYEEQNSQESENDVV